MDLITIRSTGTFLTWGTWMSKGQLSILLIGFLIAVSLTVMGIFSRNQFDELELQRVGIEALAPQVHFETFPSTPVLKFDK